MWSDVDRDGVGRLWNDVGGGMSDDRRGWGKLGNWEFGDCGLKGWDSGFMCGYACLASCRRALVVFVGRSRMLVVFFCAI